MDTCERAREKKRAREMETYVTDEYTWEYIPGAASYTCVIGDERFSVKRILQRHLRIHRGEIDSAFPCEICDKKLKSKGDPIVHLRTHTGENQYRRDLSTEDFSDKSCYRRHARMHQRTVENEIHSQCNLQAVI